MFGFEQGGVPSFMKETQEDTFIRAWKQEAKSSFHAMDGQSFECVQGKLEETAKTCLEDMEAIRGVPISLKTVLMYGSRAEGKEHEGSDLNVVVAYIGAVKEELVTEQLNQENMRIGEAPVRFQAIRSRESGSCIEFLLRCHEKANRYEIFQLDPSSPDVERLAFRPYDFLEEHGIQVDKANYKSVYQGNGWTCLDDIYCRHQFGVPGSIPFHGHSLSVGDVIVAGGKNAWYVDDIGYRYLPDFLKNETKN